MVDIGVARGRAVDINDNGKVALHSRSEPERRLARVSLDADRWSWRLLGTLSGPFRSAAINNSGQIAGDGGGSVNSAYQWTSATSMVFLRSGRPRP